MIIYCNYELICSLISLICSLSVLFLFAITAAGVVPCGGPKKSHRTSSIVQIIFSFWSFEISGVILRNQKFFFGLDSFSNQRFKYLTLFGRVGVIKIVIVINCNLITFFKIIENNCNSVFTLITIIEM